MPDADTTLEVVKDKVKAFAQEREWGQHHHPKELAISLSLEAAELLEIFQWKKPSLEEITKDKELMRRLKEELADILIYALNLANKTGIDVSQAILEKLKLNAEKYPIDKAKGSSKKYTEL